MKTKISRLGFLLAVLFACAGNVIRLSGTDTSTGTGVSSRYVDYRFAPEWSQSLIGFPDDACKTLVGPLGQMLLEWTNDNPESDTFFSFAPRLKNGYRATAHFLADEHQKFTGQRLHSARVPVVITTATYAGLDITQEAFAAADDFVGNNTPTGKGNREDIVLTTVRNPTHTAVTIRPVLVIDTKSDAKGLPDAQARKRGDAVAKIIPPPQQATVVGRIATLPSGARIIASINPVRIRKNLADFKVLVEFEPIVVDPGATRQFAILHDNALPSRLADAFARNSASLDPAALKARMIAYWENGTDIPYGHITVPDAEIQNLIDASLRGIWQAREIKDGKFCFQVGPTRYRGLWIADGATLLETAAMFDRGQAARDGVEYTLTKQQPDGRFEVIDTFWKENGIVLWTCVRHALLSQDKAWLESVWPKLRKTAAFIKQLRNETLSNDTPLDDGLIPPGFIDGGLGSRDSAEYTNIYWNLAGLKALIQGAHWLGKTSEAAALQSEYDDFFATFQKAAQRDMATDDFGNRYLAVIMDPKRRDPLPQRAQWAFCQAIYPGQIFDKDDPVATGTLAMLHTTLQQGMVMGTGWINYGIWTYFAGFYGHACLWTGEAGRAADALYTFANHASPLYAWREEHPPRDYQPNLYIGDMPHNWASALFAELAVHLIALDRGSELHLLEGIPSEWLRPGMETRLHRIATPFGKLSLTVRVNAAGDAATLKIDALSDPSCSAIVVHSGNWSDSPGQTLRLDPSKPNTLELTLRQTAKH